MLTMRKEGYGKQGGCIGAENLQKRMQPPWGYIAEAVPQWVVSRKNHQLRIVSFPKVSGFR